MLRFVAVAAATMAALSFTASAEADDQTINICTGGKSGVYYAKGKQLQAAMLTGGVKVNPINTNGSWYNINEVAKDEGGACQVAIVQADAYALLAKREKAKAAAIDRIGALHHEYVHLVCNAKLPGDDETLLEKGDEGSRTIAVGKQGSGSWVTWNNLVAEDDDYGRVTKPLFLGGTLAASKVADGAEADCLLYVAGLGSGYMHKLDANFGKDLRIRDFDDKDFNDAEDPKGNALYEFADLPREYPDGLQKPYWGANDTIRMRAIVVVNTAWAYADEERFEKLVDALATLR